jgi:hypothetical protein
MHRCFQESLQSEVVPDVMANEQNLTAEDEAEIMSQGTSPTCLHHARSRRN